MKKKMQAKNVQDRLTNPQGVTLQYREGDNAVVSRKGNQLYKKVPKPVKTT